MAGSAMAAALEQEVSPTGGGGKALGLGHGILFHGE
jgi:hypothetical protein